MIAHLCGNPGKVTFVYLSFASKMLSVFVFDRKSLFMVAVDMSKVISFFAAKEAVPAFDIKIALKEIRITDSDRDEMASITNVCLFKEHVSCLISSPSDERH